jgi:hypothetical protein
MQFMNDIWTFLASDYLINFWWLLLAGYAAAYGVAQLVARVGGRSGYTILYQCRQAWGIAFLLHALAGAGVMIYWYLHNGSLFASFWRFFPFYLTLFIVDVIVAFGLFASRRQYVNYHE